MFEGPAGYEVSELSSDDLLFCVLHHASGKTSYPLSLIIHFALKGNGMGVNWVAWFSLNSTCNWYSFTLFNFLDSKGQNFLIMKLLVGSNAIKQQLNAYQQVLNYILYLLGLGEYPGGT